jgi:MFS family permease
LASMLARLPYGVFALAAILYLAEARGSYAVAGLVDGAFGLGAAAGAPWQSRLIDRLGQRQVLVVAAVVDVTATGLLIALTEADAPTVALVACGLVGGVAVPNVGGALRAMWAGLLRGREPLLSTAFAIDSVALEVLFTAGPLLAAGIIAIASPLAALVVSAVCSLTGTLAFIAQRPSRAWRPDQVAGPPGRLGALSSSGVRTLAFAAVPVGFCFGAVEIALPGFAESHDQRELAGVLLATWSCGSLIGGLAYGAINWRRPASSVYVWLSALLPIGFLPALLASSIPTMAILIASAGLLIAPQAAATNQLIGDVAPAGAITEAYAWPVTAILVGFAPGTALGGALVDHAGWEWCFVAAALTALLGFAVVLRYRGTFTLKPEPAIS